ncbi:MAG: hypothetical protein KA712_01635 [Myxococcales bacterium]|nr:hypothetical protein [Myxococcales bacterium]
MSQGTQAVVSLRRDGGPTGRAVLAFLLRLGLGGLFMLAGFLKARDPSRFALEISNYQLMREGVSAVAAMLPAIEIVAGLALVVLPRPWRHAAATLIGIMLAMFTVAVGSAYFRGINIDCGCFGGAEAPITGLTLLRNLGLLAAAGLTVWLDTPRSRR